MSQYYQPPPIPGTGSTFGQNFAPTSSPYFTIANQFLPRNLHDVIRWSRYITTQSPVVTEVIRKYSTYPITEFTVETKSEAVKNHYERIFKKFRLKNSLHDIGFEYHTIGNVFLSIYFPIHRNLTCPHCKTRYNAKKAEFVRFRNYKFEGKCPACNTTGEFIRSDTKSTNIDDMNLVKWDPTNISVNHNPITNEYEYYYTIPNDIRRRVQTGDKLFVNSVPWGFIEAIKNNQDFKFDNDNIYHMKNMATGQQINGMPVPPLISLFSLVFYQATLRRANESIATDYMSPLRVIFPQAQTGNSDPVVALSMQNFTSHMTNAIRTHKRDKNHVLIAPTPIGYQAISGEGKNLLVSQELEQAEQTILLAMGVSRELLSGLTNWTSSTVGLRLLKNTLDGYTSQVLELVNWIMVRVAAYTNSEVCEVGLQPFKLTDDDALRNILFQLYASKQVSRKTFFESLGLDEDQDARNRIQEAVDDAITGIKAKAETDRATFVTSKEVADNLDQSGDYKTALAKAQQIAAQLYTSDQGTRRQVLNQLELEDYAMFIMVSKLLEQAREEETAAAKEEFDQQNAAGADPSAPKDEGGGSGPGPEETA